jgi:hypothetical protein
VKRAIGAPTDAPAGHGNSAASGGAQSFSSSQSSGYGDSAGAASGSYGAQATNASSPSFRAD